jgi:hypothetical protein
MNFDSVHNYFERLVLSEIRESYAAFKLNDEVLGDIACMALNRLPSKYIRHDIDNSFYMSSDEYIKNQKIVKDAVFAAYQKIAAQIVTEAPKVAEKSISTF